MSKWDYDVIIAGAGVAGSSAAIVLGQEGYRVLLLDRAEFPRHKTCGEGIMPEGVDILASLGVLPAVFEHSSPPIRGLRFRSPSGTWAQANFPCAADGPSYSVVIRRYDLDQVLVQRAKELPNVTVREGFTALSAVEDRDAIAGVIGHATGHRERVETFRAPLTLGADGMHSCFHNRYGIARHVLPRERWGIAGHLTGVEGLSAYIEVLFQSGSEIYLAPMGDDATLVAILIEKEGMNAFRGGLAKSYHEFLKASPGLCDRIAHSEVEPPVGARGPLGFRVDPVFRPGLLLVGDSAGFLDPITGEGMTLALKCVQAAVPVVRRAFERGDFGPAVLRHYAVERARIIHDVSKLTQLMLDLSQFRLLTDRAIRHLSGDEALFQKLLGIVTGSKRYGDFTLRDRLALAMG